MNLLIVYLNKIRTPDLLPASIAYPLIAGGWASVAREDLDAVVSLCADAPSIEEARTLLVICSLTPKGEALLAENDGQNILI